MERTQLFIDGPTRWVGATPAVQSPTNIVLPKFVPTELLSLLYHGLTISYYTTLPKCLNSRCSHLACSPSAISDKHSRWLFPTSQSSSHSLPSPGPQGTQYIQRPTYQGSISKPTCRTGPIRIPALGGYKCSESYRDGWSPHYS